MYNTGVPHCHYNLICHQSGGGNSSLYRPFFFGVQGNECLSSCFPATRLCFMRQKKDRRAPAVRWDVLTGGSDWIGTPAAHKRKWNLWLWLTPIFRSFNLFQLILLPRQSVILNCYFCQQSYLLHQWGVGEEASLKMTAVPSPCWCLCGGWNQTSSAQSNPTVNKSIHLCKLFSIFKSCFHTIMCSRQFM